MGEKTTRREFLRQVAVSGVALSGIGGIGAALAEPSEAADLPKGKSRVVAVTDKSCLNADGDIVVAGVKSMLNKSVQKLTGAKNSGAAWKSLFKPTDIVGVKINCLFGKNASTHPQVVDAVVAGLVMAGVKTQNIIIWDRGTNDLTKTGYVINKGGAGPQCYANDAEWGEKYTLGAFDGRLSPILDKITALVNVPILKHHGLSGISCALKNHYGSISNPGSCHDDGCNPYLGDISALAPIKDKTRLIVADAIRPFPDGGPGLKNRQMLWDYHTLLVSKDPVAMDYIGWQIIDARRKEIGLKPVEQPAKWLASATSRGVGNSDPKRIEYIRI